MGWLLEHSSVTSDVYADGTLSADHEGWVAQARRPSLDAEADGLLGLATPS